MRKISALVIFFLLFVFNPGYCISPSETIWIAPGNKPSITLYGRGLPKVAVNIYRLNYLPGRKEDILLLKLGKPVNTVVKQFKNIDANTERTILLPPVKEGIYFVTAVSGKYKNSVIVVVTKLCLVAKVEKGQSLILAFDVVKSKPAEGVDINVYSSNKVAVHGKTDKSGLFKVSLPSGDYDLRIVGRKNDSYAEIYDRIVESDNFYKVYAYTDRPIYRPNHTINYKAVIRKINEGEREYSNSPAIPVKVIVTDSFGSEIFLQDKVADEHGSISGNFTLGNEPALGTYTISFEAGGKLHYCNFQVEEYKKPEFEMEVNPLNRFFIEGQKIQAQIDAKYYLGDSLKAAAYEYSVYQKEFQLPDYDSEDKKDTYWDEPGLVSAGSSSSFAQGTFVEKGSGKLDEKGQALIEIPTDKLGYDRTYDVKVKVTDISNKTIEKSFPVLVTRAPYFLTVSSDNYVYELKQTINAKIRARKFDGQPVQLNGTAYLGHEVWNKKEQKYMFVSYDYKPFTADTDGNAKVKFTASTPGYLTIRVISSEQSPVKVLADASIEIFDSKNIKKVNMKKEKYPVLSLKQDSKFYRVGETAKILLVSKYRRGYVLLTIEGEKIHEYRMFQLNSNITMLKIPVKKEYYPTLHFKVVLLNGVNRESSALELPIRNEEKFLKVKISTYKDVYAPGEKCNVQIETADFKDQAVPSEVSLAIVDESIYAIASDMSQPIRRFFWGYRENEVATLYSESIYYNAGAYQNVGEKVKIRRKFLDTAYWNPYIITDKNGKAALEFDYPDNLTTWRLTAIGITDDTKVGRNVLKKIVRKDFYLRLDTPVFLVKGDKSTIRCHIHNSTAKDIDVNLKLTGDTFPLNIERTVKVKAGGVESLEFLSRIQSLKAPKIIAIANTSVPGVSDGLENSFRVFTPGLKESLCYSNKVEDQWALNFNVPDEVNIESFKGEISFLYSLKTILGQALDSLNSGRFESSEEAVSAFYPAILAYSELPGFEKEKEALGKEIEKIIPSLYTYQKEDGGWAWIQKGDSDPYITAYVLEALITAAQKGCFVDKERLNSGMTYLKNRIANERNPAVKVYLLRTVSMVDNSYKPLALDLFEKRNELNYCTQAILAVILQRYGEQDKAKKIIDELMAQAVKTPRSTYWESSSEKLTWTDDSIYTNAWIAYAVNLITPDSSEINKILNWLVERKKDPGWSNTKTTSRACLFLMEYLKNHPEKESAGTASVYLNKTLIAKVNLNTEKNNNRAIVEIPFEKLSPGSNTLNLIRENGSPFFATVNLTKYQPARDKVEKKDQGFTIVVQYFKRIMEYDQNGKIKYRYENLDGNIKSGDVVLAVCKVVTWNSSPFLKVEIPVPGGFENLVDEEVEGIYPSDYKFDYKYKKFVRDQKVVFYQDACYPRMYIYPILLRANLPGEYYVNPAAARLIYYEEVKGNSESRIVKINPGK